MLSAQEFWATDKTRIKTAKAHFGPSSFFLPIVFAHPCLICVSSVAKNLLLIANDYQLPGDPSGGSKACRLF